MGITVIRKKAPRPKTMIGWEEWCALPDLGLPAIRAKVDTGARTSALHATDIEILARNGGQYVRFVVHPVEANRMITRICEAPLIERRMVISSNGEREMRPVILTTLVCGEKNLQAQLTLTSRHKMSFRMLLGRAALRKARFAVDPAKSFLLGKKVDAESLYFLP